MIGPNGNGGGGIALKIIRAASVLTLPATAAANTIAVITETEITGWVFSVSAPETPAEGMVWFATGTRSPVAVNVLKKNGIWIYPASCQQYISGSWVSKTAKTYKGGAWVDFNLYLYDRGQDYPDLTGELTGLGIKTNATYGQETAPTITKASDKMTIKWYRSASGAPWDAGIAYYPKPVNFSDYSKLRFELEHTQEPSNYTYIRFGYCPVIPEYYLAWGDTEGGAYEQRRMSDAAWETVELDVSGVSGAQYIIIGANQETNGINATAGVTSICLTTPGAASVESINADMQAALSLLGVEP